MRTTLITLVLVLSGCGATTDGACTCPPGWMCVADGCAAICATNDDCDPNQACVNSLCRDSTPGPLDEPPEEPPPEEPPPEEPPPEEPPPDADNDATVCLGAFDQTVDATPDDIAGDQGLVYDSVMAFEGTEGACCGDDADEWYLYQQGDPTVAACCDRESDCVDNDGVCYDSNTLTEVSTSRGTGEHVCYHNWWYTCNDVTLCLTHYRREAGEELPNLDYECLFTAGAFVFANDTTVPAEECFDGYDNDCDGNADLEDDDCCGGFGEPQCSNGTCDGILEPCFDGTCMRCCEDTCPPCDDGDPHCRPDEELIP